MSQKTVVGRTERKPDALNFVKKKKNTIYITQIIDPSSTDVTHDVGD